MPRIVAEEYEKLPSEIRSAIPLELLMTVAESKKQDIHRGIREYADSIMPHLQSAMERTLPGLVGVLCLTESPDNLLMWAHYAKSHQGFVVEFDGNDKFFNRRRSDEDEFFHLRKVRYSAKRPSVALADVSFDIFLTKGEEWEREQEWRMLVPLADACEVRPIPESPVPAHLFSFPKQVVRSVIAGARASEDLKQRISSIIESDPEYDHVVLKKVLIDEGEYRLNIVDW